MFEWVTKKVRIKMGELLMAVRVVIADDAAFMRMVLKNLMIKNGFEVVAEVENGEQAIAAYRVHRPDLMTMDINMPEMDGFQALKEIISEDPTAKIIMCSAVGHEAMVAAAIKAGAKDFVVKPFEAERVIDKIRKQTGY